ncbi:YSIRK-type signal peptide-containing protein [Streptococcus sp. LPB0220]|uniref:CshA/CshB family fibrillar adhesin-related protein n=2 Tax=unclassified Streptococcus TaxID=2608887 RepID=UPI00124639A8|nr:CshA/CshB family fibrillar adhesin-related protein [Streptococcus sp. LPB0220]QEW09814.1 YSIRK-type signal peptide-containing protein [Streptococcus sp. LPB0220]
MGKDLFNDRISRFSIRKLNVGVCSVLLGTLVMVGTAASAAAEEKKDTTNESVAAVATASEAQATSTAVSAASTAETTSTAPTTYEANPAVTAAATSTAPASTSEVSSTSTAASATSSAPATSETAKLEATTPVNKAAEAASTTADKKETPTLSAGQGVTANNTVATEETANTSRRRTRRAIGDPNDESLIGDDVEDATSTPKVEKPGFTTNVDAKSMASQISWLDFGDVANWTGTTTVLVPKSEVKPTENLEEKLALQVGSTYTKEIMPGYVVTVKVKSLKPFQATEIYKKRMENQGATEAEKATYDPNAKNGYVSGVTSNAAKQAFNNGEEAKIVADAQNNWTEIRFENIDTKTKKTTISSALNGGNIGVQFEISATFRGKTVKPAIVMADGESANPGELVMFTTNGEGWQHIGEWKKFTRPKTSVTYEPQDTENLFGPNPKFNNTNLNQLRRSTEVGPEKKPVAWKYFGNPDKVTGGLGTGIFGPNISEGNRTVPIVMTRGASEVGLYIASGGKQSAMLGFFPLDEGDAPESYGKAVHTIATVDGVTGAKVNQPYLGNVSPDMDENTTLDWFGDDKATTADEGINQLLPDELKGTTNEMIKMDRTRPGNYKLSVQAHTDGASEAHIYGWVDFNQNGKFDEDERSNLATITQDGTVELTFANSKTYIDPSVKELGARVRIAKKATEIESPTGMAFSGEVEDFRTQITHPPKGEFKETSGPQGAKQTATVTFTARGEHKYELNSSAVIDETVEPYIVDKDGNRATLDADGYYVVPGQGKYKITANGKDVDVEFIPEDNFLGTADGISIRRSDNNGYDTGWSTKFPDQEANINGQLNTMDGQYVPTVTPIEIEGVDKTSTDVQGATQKETPTFNTTATNSNGEKIAITPSAEYPAKLVDPATGLTTDAPSVTVEGEGTYTINPSTGEVTFTPDPSFTGTAKGVDVTLSAPVGRNKEGKVQEEYIKTATAKYTPTVTPITVTPTDKVSADVQNVPQTQTPTFDLSNDKTAEITSKKLVDPATGQPTDETTVTVAGEGSYTIDPTTGAVTFTPEKDFVGTAKGVTVQATATITNANGKTATITSDATYTPTVVPAVPTANPATSKDVQGATQTGTPTFAGTTVQVNGEDKAITIKDNSYTLLDNDGNEVSSTPAYAEDGTTPIGTFTIDPATGQVTFTPTDKSYTGKVTPAKVQAESSNGIKVDTTYTPEIVPVTPTATPAETTDIQGATQTGKPEFKGGTVTVDGVEKTVEINEAVPAKFDDGSTTKTVEGIGTYTVAADGTVTFVPEKSFVGTAPAVTVVREDKNGTKASATYTPTVLPVTPTATPAETTDIQGATQKGKPEFKGGTVTVDGVEKTVEINEDVPATFDDGSTTKTVEGVGTYTVAADGTVTFVPEKSFTGKAPAVTVVREDKNGTKASATYTPTVTPVTPTAKPVETTDIQGATQTGKPVFTEGDSRVPMNDDVPATFDNGSTTKTVDGVGTYTVAADGTVTFVPEKSFTGTAPAVTVVREDKNGTKASATYTPTVTPVTPTATPVETTGKQGQTQTGKPEFTEGDSRVPMNDDVPATFDDGSTTKSVDGVGTYTVAADGTVTFVPEKSFTGKAPAVTVVREDKNGTKASATYTPTVTPVTPTATPAESTGPQGLVQTGTVTFTEGDEVAPINKDSITLLDENGQPAASVEAKSPAGDVIGTYTVDKDTGVVTFTPTDKSYSGDVVPVKVQAADANGTTVETTYTPKITPVVPTSEDATSTDIQGQTQSGKPTFTEGNPNVPIDEDTPATFEDGSTTKTVDGEGTYTVAPDGTVTFVPEKSFTGTATGVTVKRVDKNGTEITAKYTPTVTPVTPTATPAESTDIQGATQTGKPKFTEGDSRVPMNDDVPATFDDGSTTKTIDGVGTYTVAADGTVTFVPEKSFVGTAPAVTVVREDKNGTKASATYTPTVTPVTPTAEDTTSTDKQGQTQTGTPTFTPGNPNVPMDDDTPATFEDGSTTKTIPGEGTYTVAPDGTVTFVPEKSFTGEGTGVTVKRVDKNGTPVTAKYTPTVTPVTPTASSAESEAPQGVVQTGTVNFTEGDPVAPIDKDTITLLDENGQPAESVVAKSPEGKEIGTFTVDKETGVVTFTPTDKSYSGDVVPVKVQGKDTNGTVAETTYTPKITPVVPTADPATSTDIQGKTQTGTPSFTPGNPAIPMDDDVPATFEDGSTTKVIPGEGTYTVAPDGTVTFVPEKSFTGTGTGVTVKRVDKNGTPVTATYTPTVTPVTPTAKPTTSTDIQGATQTGKPEFTEGDSRVPMNDDVPATFDDGSTTKTVDGVGTYTVAPDGTVTFVPEKSFVGTAPAVTVVREDKNGTKASATYTPTVTPVTPTATPAVSTDIQGATQTGKPVFTEGDSRVPMNDDVPATFDDGSTTKTVKGVGTYTVAPDGTVTFVPEKSFVGTAPAVTVVREDKNGTKASATYTPTVTPVTPTADPATSTDIQGQTQTGKPSFTPGNPSVPMDDDVPATFEDGSTTKVIPGEGTYTVSPDGTVTFVPEKSFTGTGTGVTVKRVDKNGTPITATYTPTVKPVTPTAEPVTSIGKKGQTQTGKPTFTEGDSRVPMNDGVPATFEDGSTTKTIPGVGTYTVAADGTVTFTPEPEFTGTAPAVTVVREDVNGTKASATYTPTVLPITKFVDKDGKEIPGYPTVDGEEPKAEIPGYHFVETKKLPNGDTEHVYEKVTTSYVDENGDPIPGNPTEDGEQPKKDIPGYDFVKTVVDKDGNTQHIYKKTVTPTPMPDPTPTPEPQPQPTPQPQPQPTPQPQPNPQPKPEEPTIPVVPETKEEVKYIDPQNPTAQLPNTGTKESSTAGLAIFSALAGLSLFGFAKRKKED